MAKNKTTSAKSKTKTKAKAKPKAKAKAAPKKEETPLEEPVLTDLNDSDVGSAEPENVDVPVMPEPTPEPEPEVQVEPEVDMTDAEPAPGDTWRDRLKSEAADLKEKMVKLRSAIDERKVPLDQVPILNEQYGAMMDYYIILNRRLSS